MCACAHATARTCLVCLHAVQLTCVLDMCNTFTKHNGSGQVVRVGAAAPRVFKLEIVVLQVVSAPKARFWSHFV